MKFIPDVSSRRLGTLLACGVALTAAVPQGAYADPPPWAPAHGWRKKHDPNYVGYTGKKWEQDYGVVQGNCNRQAAGAAVGAAAGAAVGSQIGGGDGRKIAIIVGTVLGAVIGAKIGRDADNADRACIGQALELTGDNRSVRWSAPDKGPQYLLTPVSGFEKDGLKCRNYKLSVSQSGKQENLKGAACRKDDGTWQVVSQVK